MVAGMDASPTFERNLNLSYEHEKQQESSGLCFISNVGRNTRLEYFFRTISPSSSSKVENKPIVTPENDKRIEVKYFSAFFVYTEHYAMGNSKGSATAKDHAITELVTYLASNLTVQNCLCMKELAAQNNFDELQKLAMEFLEKNFAAVIKTDAFTSIDQSDLRIYLKSFEISREISWRAVVKWVEASTQREHNILDLMETINIESFPFDFLLKEVLQQPLVQKSAAVRSNMAKLILLDADKIRTNISIDNVYVLYKLARDELSPEAKEAKDVIDHFVQTICHVEELLSLEKELNQKREQKVQKSRKIGASGGNIELYGCYLTFPPGALKAEMEITISVDNNAENFPKGLEPVVPILGFKPSMQFDKPVSVEMRTWFSAKKGRTISGVLSSQKQGFEWKKVADIEIEDTNIIKFTVTHFCRINLGIEPQNIHQGEYTILNDVYIQKDTCHILSVFYLDAKSEKEIWDSLRRRNCAVFSPRTQEIFGRPEQRVTTKIIISHPQQQEITRGYAKNDFPIQGVVKSQNFRVQYIPRPPLTEYEGLIEGEHIIYVDGTEEDRTYLSRRWPVTLDPPDLRPVVNLPQAQIELLNVGQ